MSFEIPSGAGRLLGCLASAGFEAYLVGGCVRDLLRGVEPHDWDICTSALPHQVESCFSSMRVIETGLRHGTVTVMEDGEPYEITTFRADGEYTDGRHPDSVRFVPDLREDLARRDFTMNAVAMTADGTLTDPFGGAEDIKRRVIRCVGEPERRFGEDSLRVMRALRFASVLGFELEERTAAAVHSGRTGLRRVAPERIRVELVKLITGENAGTVLRAFPDVLAAAVPELGALEDLDGAVCEMESLPRDAVTRLAALLGDAAADAMRSLRFDNATRRRVEALVKYRDAELSTGRLAAALGPEDLPRLLELRGADAETKSAAGAYLLTRPVLTPRDLKISGADVIAAGVTPGPQVGRVLGELFESVLDGRLPNDRAALLDALKGDIRS